MELITKKEIINNAIDTTLHSQWKNQSKKSWKIHSNYWYTYLNWFLFQDCFQ